MRISDWSSDVCSSDLATAMPDVGYVCLGEHDGTQTLGIKLTFSKRYITLAPVATVVGLAFKLRDPDGLLGDKRKIDYGITRSEEHTSELQSLMRISYAVFCLQKKNHNKHTHNITHIQ